jgi:3-oxoacyl-ACP reductase-like protein
VGAASAEAAVAASENGSASAVAAAEADAVASADDASVSDLASTLGGITSVSSTGSGVTSSLIVSSCVRTQQTCFNKRARVRCVKAREDNFDRGKEKKDEKSTKRNFVECELSAPTPLPPEGGAIAGRERVQHVFV